MRKNYFIALLVVCLLLNASTHAQENVGQEQQAIAVKQQILDDEYITNFLATLEKKTHISYKNKDDKLTFFMYPATRDLVINGSCSAVMLLMCSTGLGLAAFGRQKNPVALATLSLLVFGGLGGITLYQFLSDVNKRNHKKHYVTLAPSGLYYRKKHMFTWDQLEEITETMFSGGAVNGQKSIELFDKYRKELLKISEYENLFPITKDQFIAVVRHYSQKYKN